MCGEAKRPVSITFIKCYLLECETQGNLWPETKEALRWFVIEARKRAFGAAITADGARFISKFKVKGEEGKGVGGAGDETTPSPRNDAGGAVAQKMSPYFEGGVRRGALPRSEPTRGAEGLGGPEWEQALVKAVRRDGKLWRTEQTYRSWAWRFVDFIRPVEPRRVGVTEVRAFLEDLAVRQRVGPSTQKQALNAVVFFLDGALGVELGDFSDFVRASPRRRVPVVLSRVEVRALFGELEGTSKLMAEMAYGGGLRLIELLRLRVQDVDLERRQVVVRGGKGD